jgi:hypothetical protein
MSAINIIKYPNKFVEARKFIPDPPSDMFLMTHFLFCDILFAIAFLRLFLLSPEKKWFIPV